jgi:hypothetical protein
MIGQQEILNLEVFRQNSLFLDLGNQTYLFLLLGFQILRQELKKYILSAGQPL